MSDTVPARPEAEGRGFWGSRGPAENKLFVKKVDPDGWAAQHGVKEDDELFQARREEGNGTRQGAALCVAVFFFFVFALYIYIFI